MRLGPSNLTNVPVQPALVPSRMGECTMSDTYVEHDLVDRIEEFSNGSWSCIEMLCVICPACGEETDFVLTEPDYTEYAHRPINVSGLPVIEFHVVYCTAEPLPPSFEKVRDLIMVPEELRGQIQ